MKRLLFFDIDGTLAIPGQLPGEAVVEAVRSARRAGHLAFLSTGRTESTVPPAVAAIGFDGGIYSAGARIVVDGQVLLDRAMPRALSDRIRAAVEDAVACYALECASGAYRSQEEFLLLPEEGGSSELMRMATETGWRKLEEYTGEPIYKISFQAESREQVERAARRLEGEPVSFVCFENMVPGVTVLAGEVSDRDVDKGRAVGRVCAHFGLGLDRAVAFGDSMNDAAMLRAAGIGVAMGNAPEEVKALADQVCESCADGGVAKALARMGLTEGL